MLQQAVQAKDVWRTIYPRAWQEHDCATCRSKIKVGDTYLKHLTREDGDLVSDIVCCVCGAMWTDFSQRTGMALPPSCLEDMLHDGIEAHVWHYGDLATRLLKTSQERTRTGLWRSYLATLKRLRRRAGHPR